MAAHLSTSPNRGPMLTSQDEVEERLKKMNETFLKSLEGIDGNSARRKDRQKVSTKAGKDSKAADDALLTSTAKSKERPGSSASNSSAASNSNASAPRASRGLALGFPSTSSRGGAGDAYPPYLYNTPSLGLGIERGRHGSASSSTMGNSDAMASQGSEEVIGRMDLYEERRRSGYQGP